MILKHPIIFMGFIAYFVNYSALSFAAWYENIKIVQLLLEQESIDVNIQDILNSNYS